jgi:Succinyl-CoA synthetase, alpha subunit
MIYVPAIFAAAAIIGAIDASVELMVCFSEGIPFPVLLDVSRSFNGSHRRLIGPKKPGLITPAECGPP